MNQCPNCGHTEEHNPVCDHMDGPPEYPDYCRCTSTVTRATSRVILCVYCGQSVVYDADPSKPEELMAARDQLIVHDQSCQKNPLVQTIAQYRKFLVDFLNEQVTMDVRIMHLENKIDDMEHSWKEIVAAKDQRILALEQTIKILTRTPR